MMREKRSKSLRDLGVFVPWYAGYLGWKAAAWTLHTANRGFAPAEKRYERERKRMARPATLTELPRIPRSEIDRVLAERAPPGIPYEHVVVRREDLQARSGAKVRFRQSRLDQSMRMTPADIPSPTVVVLLLFTDVSSDYYIETMAKELRRHVNGKYGRGVAPLEKSAILLKEMAVAAGLGTIGKNSLFFGRRFGLNCKIEVIFLHADVDQYSEIEPAASGPEPWKLPSCEGCDACIRACPVNAIADFKMERAIACDRVISAEFFGENRNHSCRACVTSCPPSNLLLKEARANGAPRLKFWDNEEQLNYVADIIKRPSVTQWVMQRFYFGAGIPGQPERPRSSGQSASQDGWRDAARRVAKPPTPSKDDASDPDPT